MSDTEEIYWDEKKGIITLNTPRTQAVLGKAGDGVISLSAVKFHISTPFVSLILTSLDNESLAQSSHLLLAAVARSENAGTIYNPSRTLLRTSGTSPILMEPVLGQASLTLGGRPLPQVFALDPRGNRVGEIPVEESHGALEIPLRGAHAYEILFGEKA